MDVITNMHVQTSCLQLQQNVPEFLSPPSYEFAVNYIRKRFDTLIIKNIKYIAEKCKYIHCTLKN